MPRRLTESGLREGVRELPDRDAGLRRIATGYGAPPMWAREPGFHTLVQIILEQQVSLASARAANQRLVEAIGRSAPEAFLELSDSRLKAIGFSRQKTRYCRLLAEAVHEGSFDIEGLEHLDDGPARTALTSLTGIGRWTADIYLLMALLRPDVWPVGDIALATAAGKLRGAAMRPDPGQLESWGEAWRPWRSVAARLLWHYYLSDPGVRARS